MRRHDMVPSVSEIDMDEVTHRVRLVAFDLDNTLARSRQPMAPRMATLFSEITARIETAVVTGGSYDLVVSQVLDTLTDEARPDRLHVMPTNGARRYRWIDGKWTLEQSSNLGEADGLRAARTLEACARRMGMWPDDPWGDVIENRGSQITFSALGQRAPESAKRAYDASGERLAALAREVQSELPDLQVRAGGFTSIDVSARGIDKAYAVRELARVCGVGVGQIVFVGDRMTAGGNDYPAAQAGTIAVRVSGPEDTQLFCERLLAGLGA